MPSLLLQSALLTLMPVTIVLELGLFGMQVTQVGLCCFDVVTEQEFTFDLPILDRKLEHMVSSISETLMRLSNLIIWFKMYHGNKMTGLMTSDSEIQKRYLNQ